MDENTTEGSSNPHCKECGIERKLDYFVRSPQAEKDLEELFEYLFSKLGLCARSLKP